MASILVADDDPVVQHIVGSILRGAGHSVEIAKSGAEFLSALNACTVTGALPDLIFLDLQLPDMTGAEILPQIRAASPQRRIPVIVVSANSEDETRNLFPGIDLDGYLEKPFTPPKLLGVISEFLSG